DAENLETLAQWYAWRPTWVAFQSNSGKMDKLVWEFEHEFVMPCNSANFSPRNRDFVRQMGPHFAKAFKAVFDRDFLSTRMGSVNAALMLPALAKLKQEEVGDMLKDLINDPKVHDAVKVHAIKALREFFPVKTLDDADNIKDAEVAKKKKRDLERI